MDAVLYIQTAREELTEKKANKVYCTALDYDDEEED
jgi:hypothetical protein